MISIKNTLLRAFNLTKKIWWEVRDFLIIIGPEYWVMLYKYDQEWDLFFNHLLDNNSFQYFDTFKVELGGYLIWVENYPYGSYHMTTVNEPTQPRRTPDDQRVHLYWAKGEEILHIPVRQTEKDEK